MAVALAFETGKPIRLWSGDAPLTKGTGENDIPTITPYLPKKSNGVAIVICPGGAYWILAEHEGKDYAEFLSMHGYTAFVLKYRLGQFGYRHPAMLTDAQRAIRTIRATQSFRQVGIMGSSAGGHLAATASVHFALPTPQVGDEIDAQSARPDFTILCYPVISMEPPVGHSFSRDQLLGKDPGMPLIQLLSPAKHVSKDTPPAYLWHTVEDEGVPIENSHLYAEALRRNNIPFELHLFEKGAHGIGLNDKAPFKKVHPWATNLIYWLNQRLPK